MKQTVMAFSVGLLTATVILGIVYWMENRTDASESNQQVSEEDIESYTNENQLTLLSQSEYEALMDENDTLQEQVEQLQEEMSTNSSDSEEETNESSNEEDTDQEEVPVTHYNFEIESGMTSLDIADQLAENEIIDEEQSFIDYMQENDLSQTIQLGTYEVDSSMSIDEIAALMTR